MSVRDRLSGYRALVHMARDAASFTPNSQVPDQPARTPTQRMLQEKLDLDRTAILTKDRRPSLPAFLLSARTRSRRTSQAALHPLLALVAALVLCD